MIAGETHTYMEGRGVLQELDGKRPADLPSVLAPLVKASYGPRTQRELSDDLANAFLMTTGRSGPAFVSLPMDVQAESTVVPETHAVGVHPPEPLSEKAATRVIAAVDLLANAARPVIVAGGGVTLANAESQLLAPAERTGAAVVTTLQGKGCFPEETPCTAGTSGPRGRRSATP